MKAIFLFILFSCLAFGQVKHVTATLDADEEADIHSNERNYSFFYITVALADSADTVKVFSGTNDPDSTTATNESYTQAVLTNISSGSEVTEITGDELTNTFIGRWSYKRVNWKIQATAWSDTITYDLEWY